MGGEGWQYLEFWKIIQRQRPSVASLPELPEKAKRSEERKTGSSHSIAMAKRAAVTAAAGSDDGLAAYNKRQKISHDVPAGEDVHSSGQLRQLLSFDQDLRRSRHGTSKPKSCSIDEGERY